jgi:endoglucanase
MRTKTILTAFVLWLVSIHCVGQTMNIRINQCGYYPQATKIALVIWTNDSTFEVLDTRDSSVVFSGNLSKKMYYPDAGDSLRQADFSSLATPGTYCIRIPGKGISMPFEISKQVLRKVAYGSLKSFYFQRCSYELKAEYAGLWARKAGHPDTSCIYHASTGRTGKAPSPKGWYDAGDFGKYVVNAGITVANLLQFYELYSWYFPDSSLIIPESGNGINDLLDEVKFELDWLRTMQDTDGGVFHKITTPSFPGFIMPDADKTQRYFVGKTTAPTLDFAAMMAMAGRIYKPFDSVYAIECTEMAKKAWAWATLNPNKAFTNPTNPTNTTDITINTGEYGDGSFSDEFIWAASELLITTKDSAYYKYLMSKKNSLTYAIPGWPNVLGLGLQSLATIPNIFDATQLTKIKNSIISKAKNLKSEIVANPARITNTGYYWGCNGAYAQTGVGLVYGYLLSKDTSYLRCAGELLDYELGKNATAYSYFSFYGKKTMMDPHHRASFSDKVRQPIPGFLAGGPANNRNDGAAYAYPNLAKSYTDIMGSYTTNEVCINWNAPVTFLLGALDAIWGDSAAFYDSPVTIINDPANTTLNSPAAGSKWPQNKVVEIKVTASDADGIAKVEYYIDNKYLGTKTESPYVWSLTGLKMGDYTLSANVFDATGLVIEKASRISITDPVNIESNKDSGKDIFEVYPNPINNLLTITYKVNESGLVNLVLTDVSGKIIKMDAFQSIKGEKGSFIWKDLNLSPTCVYFVSMLQGNRELASAKILSK